MLALLRKSTQQGVVEEARGGGFSKVIQTLNSISSQKLPITRGTFCGKEVNDFVKNTWCAAL